MFLLTKEENRYIPNRDGKNYNGLDLVKFICAILVFMIHIPPFRGELTQCMKYVNFGLRHSVCRVAVPFFFMSSGFLLYKKMPLYKPDPQIIREYCFKILRLLGIWYVLLFVGGKIHLWYLGASVVAVIILSLCLHFRVKLGYAYAIAGVLYIIGLLGDSYYGIIAPLENIKLFQLVFKGYRYLFSTTRNGVFMGFIFVLMGATLSNSRFRLKPGTAMMGFVASLLCLIGEAFLLKRNDIPAEYNMYVFLLPATFFLFSFAVSVELKDRPIYRHLRSIGMLVFFSHLLINKLTSLAIGAVDRFFNIGLWDHQFILTLIFTLLVAVGIDWLSCQKRFQWLKWIIS